MAGEPVAGPRQPSKLEAVSQARRAPLDEARPAAIARHKAKGRLTARANIADLLDAATLVADTRRLLSPDPRPPARTHGAQASGQSVLAGGSRCASS